jgi:hypothetical protein
MCTRSAMLRPLALTALCFAIALAVVAFVPQPVPLAVESSPDTIKAGDPSHSLPTPVTYNNRGEW